MQAGVINQDDVQSAGLLANAFASVRFSNSALLLMKTDAIINADAIAVVKTDALIITEIILCQRDL